MKLLYRNCADKGTRLDEYISQQVCGDYIYDYPPRQTYEKQENNGEIRRLITESLAADDELNLYFHFPFCRQICAYCNLFAIRDISPARFEDYFSYLKRELDGYLPYISGKKINTIYLGGGTPSWIPARLFRELFSHLEEKLDVNVHEVEEVSIEMSPDTATPERLRQYREAGINRANIGVQAVNSSELSCIGRGYSEALIFTALENVMNAGLNNVCVDLIYGLEGQSMDSWKKSLQRVVSYMPQTVCPYPLTLRERTGFAMKGFDSVNGGEQYRKYEYARDFLLSNGYEQETHVRYKLKNSHGGYVQKENHWKQQNILGLGAGARSYLKRINCRNGYSVVDRNGAFERYLELISQNGSAIQDGFTMTEDERIRKMLVLGLGHLSISAFEADFGNNPMELYPAEFAALMGRGLIEQHGDAVSYTQEGQKYRDLIVQMFFSDSVNELIYHHSYNE